MKLNIVLIATIFFAAAMAATVRAQAGATSMPVAPQATAAAPLAPDKRIERELAGGQSHAYQLTLIAGQYLHLVVDQRGIDVVLVLYGPDGKKLGEVDSPNGANGPEPLYWIVETTGIYKIEVRSFDRTAATGRYEARIEELRAATKDDRSRVFAQKLLAEAELLRAQRTADSLRKSIDKYEESLLHLRAASDRHGEAMTLNAIGLVYDDLGEKLKALDYYAQALPLFRAVSDHSGEAITLNNIGKVYSDLGEKQKALDYYTQALPTLRAVGDPGSEGTELNNIGVVYSDLGQKQKALDYYAQALPLRRAAGDRGGEGLTLNNIGNVYSELGEKQKALDYYAQALPLFRAIGDRGGEAKALSSLAYVELNSGNLTDALTNIEAAIDILESLRTKITNAQLRSSYFATVQDYYQFYIDLLMRLNKLHPRDGYDAAALQTNERARARVLLEMLAEAGADIHQGADPQLLTRERSLQQQLNVKAQLQIKLLSGIYTEPQAVAIGKEIDALTREYQEVETEIRQKSPRYAALTQPQPLSLREIQTEVLDPDTLLLEYSLGEERSYLWAVTQDSISSYEMPGRAEIEKVVRQVYRLFTNAKQWPQISVVNPSGHKESQAKRGLMLKPQGATLDSAFRLSRMVLSPVAAQLGRKRLVIVADGALQFIPFVALPNPSARKKARAYQPLIFEHEVVSLPSASTLAVLRRETKNRQPAAKELAVLADPVFDSNDDRLRNKGSATPQPLNNGPAEARGIGLAQEQLLKAAKDSEVVLNGLSIPRLPGTRREADAIIQLAPASESKKALDFEASRQTATSEELRRYRYVHFATHGFLDSQRPELSGVVLSMVDEHGRPQDGFLRAHEIFNLKLPAELVVLSACETGLGQEVKGEGLIGLARGFMYAGAPRVVVSLWSINDTATAELITRFYKGILAEKMRPAQALQAAQVSVSKEKGYSAPFFWAAFTLQGEWK